MSKEYKKFLYIVDTHWGYERRSGHKVPRHDPKAIAVALAFAQTFKPDTLILGGDILDCFPISHHERNRPGQKEGLRLATDAEECVATIIEPLDAIGVAEKHFIIGNHEDWLDDLVGEIPGLGGLLDVRNLLALDKSWSVVPQGGYVNLGKLTFVHGDTISGGEHIAKAGVINYERNIRFGHFHTYQTYTKTTPVDNKFGKTGIAVPCLCSRAQKYGEGKPNKWVQGFNYGYVFPDGTFADYVALITNGRTVVDGKVYRA